MTINYDTIHIDWELFTIAGHEEINALITQQFREILKECVDEMEERDIHPVIMARQLFNLMENVLVRFKSIGAYDTAPRTTLYEKTCEYLGVPTNALQSVAKSYDSY